MDFSAVTSILLSSAILVHLGALFQVFGLLIRDQLILRMLILVGTVFYILYYYFAGAGPQWSALLWSTIMGAVNTFMILMLLLERTTYRMSGNEITLFRVFSTMSPGEFRRLLKVCKWRTSGSKERLIDEGEPNNLLYYVLDAAPEIHKAGAVFKMESGCFIGELSFLMGSPASATVVVPKGTLYAYWTHDALTEIERRHPSMRVAIREILNVDLAAKVMSSGRNTEGAAHRGEDRGKGFDKPRNT